MVHRTVFYFILFYLPILLGHIYKYSIQILDKLASLSLQHVPFLCECCFLSLLTYFHISKPSWGITPWVTDAKGILPTAHIKPRLHYQYMSVC